MHSASPAAGRTLSRREVLVGAGRTAAGLTLLAVTASACGSNAEPEVDPLQEPYDMATSDAALARSAALAAPPALEPALTQIASERAEHAQALAEELARAGHSAPTTTETTTSTTTTENAGTSGVSGTPTSPAPPPPSPADVADALKRSADAATDLAPSLSGYRAGLLGSIAAACTASYTVTLPSPKEPS